ncbi:hypothetical protein ACLMJK_004969 [Lecanora helva]
MGYNTSQALLALPGFMPRPEQAQLRFFTVFFGANDACLPGSSSNQHVPLERFKQNLRDIVKHPSVIAQDPRIILVSPPPVNEYRLEETDLLEGLTDPRRTAEHTKQYADATREVGAELGLHVLDIWSIFMSMTGWKEGQDLVGSKKVERSKVLDSLLADGMITRDKEKLNDSSRIAKLEI